MQSTIISFPLYLKGAPSIEIPFSCTGSPPEVLLSLQIGTICLLVKRAVLGDGEGELGTAGLQSCTYNRRAGEEQTAMLKITAPTCLPTDWQILNIHCSVETSRMLLFNFLKRCSPVLRDEKKLFLTAMFELKILFYCKEDLI